jgi:protein transport protein SEC61 subunit alpha
LLFIIILVVAILLAIVQSVVLVFTGLYGNPSEIGTVGCGLLVLQLVLSSYVILSLDELIQKGYGLGSGINLFVTANLCQYVFWNTLSFASVSTIRGDEKQGALISLFNLLSSRSDKARAIKDAFYRADVANMLNVLATVVIFGLVVYVQNFRIDLPVQSNRMRGQRASYPVKLFYTSAMPIMLQSALFANVLLISHALFTFFGNNILIRLLGVWEPVSADSSLLVPARGLVYYISAPHGLKDALFSPVHTVVYLAITIVTCVYLSKIWVEISGSSSRDVARQLKDQQLTIAGFRDASMYKELQRVIPTAAAFGGAALAIIAIIGDIFGVLGSGAGILMLVMIVFQYFEMFVREQMEGNMTMEAMMGGAQ